MMEEDDTATRRTHDWLGIAATSVLLTLTLLLPWTAQRRLSAWLDAQDARTLDESSQVLSQLVTQQGNQLVSSVALLSEDARVRAMVLTPSFDRATVVDLLSDLKRSSGASVVALLDGSGTVRAAVGAPELEQLDLGTTSLVRSAREAPAAQLWAFAGGLGVSSVGAVRLDEQVRALILVGYALEDALLRDIERSVGSVGAVFVGDRVVATANTDPEVVRALRWAAEQPPGRYRVLDGAFLATSGPLSAAAAGARVAWLVPRDRYAEMASLIRALAWLPTLLVGLGLAALLLALALRQVARTPLFPS